MSECAACLHVSSWGLAGSLFRRALIFALMAAIALGAWKLRRRHIRKAEESRVLRMEWLPEREANQTQNHGTAGWETLSSWSGAEHLASEHLFGVFFHQELH